VADHVEQHLQVLLRHCRHHHEAIVRAHRLVHLTWPFGRELRGLNLVDQHAQHRIHQRDVDGLAAPALLALVQGHLHRTEGVGRAHHVGDEDAVVGRSCLSVLVLAIGHLVARGGVNHRRIRRGGGARAGLPEAGNRGVDQPRVLINENGVVEAQAFHHARAEVLHHHIGLQRQLTCQALAFWRRQVQHHAALAAVHAGVIGADAATMRLALAHHVAVGRFYLDHVGAGIGQHARAHRPAHDDGEVDDAQAGECVAARVRGRGAAHVRARLIDMPRASRRLAAAASKGRERQLCLAGTGRICSRRGSLPVCFALSAFFEQANGSTPREPIDLLAVPQFEACVGGHSLGKQHQVLAVPMR
jgi:hypothetical protein